MSFVPPPCEEFTTSEPSRTATRVRPPGTIMTSLPDSTKGRKSIWRGATPCSTNIGQVESDKVGWAMDSVDLFEINEAFAPVPLVVAQELGIPMEKVNPNGGAIALGHPLGATGAMLLATALHELERTGQRRALITLCIGYGMGIATIIDRKVD